MGRLIGGNGKIPDDRARARARLDARLARLETEEGNAGLSCRAAASGPRSERASAVLRRGSVGTSRKVEAIENRPTGDVASSRPRGVSDASSRNVSLRPSREVRTPRGGGVLSGLSPRVFLFALIAVLLIVALTFAIRGCSSSSNESSANVDGGQQQAISGTGSGDGSGAEPAEPVPDQAALASIMGEDLAAQMVELSATNEDLYWIAAHPDAVGVDDPKAQRKLLKLATVEPAAIPFVRNYPNSYPDDAAEACDPLGADVDIPLLMQWIGVGVTRCTVAQRLARRVVARRAWPWCTRA